MLRKEMPPSTNGRKRRSKGTGTSHLSINGNSQS